MSFTLTITTPPKEKGGEPKTTVSDPLETRANLHTVAYWAMRAATPWRHPDELSRYARQIVNRPVGVETAETGSGLKFQVNEYHPESEETK